MNTHTLEILALTLAASGVSFLIGMTWEKISAFDREIEQQEREARGLQSPDLK
jgi:hypothetical protein